MNRKKILSYTILLLLFLLCISCTSQNKTKTDSAEQSVNLQEIQEIGHIDPATGNILIDRNRADVANGTKTAGDQVIKKATITANGDHLIHDLIYMSAYDPETDSYDFKENYDETKSLTESADLAIGNFEGTMCPDLPLSGYPIFNSPPELAEALKYAGYDLMSFANNHMADSNGPGILSTVDFLSKQGIDVFGVNLPNRDFIVVKDINGIKFSFLSYSYAFNGMEGALTEEEQKMLSWIDPIKIEQDIEKAKAMSDIVVVFPHMGIEYDLQPDQEQIDLYHNMIDWGADLVIGNHPHVIQPIEKYQDKFILYSMGNFISNQRVETGLDIWTERGVSYMGRALCKWFLWRKWLSSL